MEEVLEDRIEQLGKGFRAFLPGMQQGKSAKRSSSEAAAPMSEGICTFEGMYLVISDIKQYCIFH